MLNTEFEHSRSTSFSKYMMILFSEYSIARILKEYLSKNTITLCVCVWGGGGGGVI